MDTIRGYCVLIGGDWVGKKFTHLRPSGRLDPPRLGAATQHAAGLRPWTHDHGI